MSTAMQLYTSPHLHGVVVVLAVNLDVAARYHAVVLPNVVLHIPSISMPAYEY